MYRLQNAYLWHVQKNEKKCGNPLGYLSFVFQDHPCCLNNAASTWRYFCLDVIRSSDIERAMLLTLTRFACVWLLWWTIKTSFNLPALDVLVFLPELSCCWAVHILVEYVSWKHTRRLDVPVNCSSCTKKKTKIHWWVPRADIFQQASTSTNISLPAFSFTSIQGQQDSWLSMLNGWNMALFPVPV